MRVAKTKTVQLATTVGYKCDCCHKKIDGEELPDNWHNFSIGHRDWGNDSIDSVEEYDVCSPECYFKIMNKAAEAMSGRDSAYIDHMELPFVNELLKYVKS